MKLTKEQSAEVNLMLATFKSFEEQLYNLKGVHKFTLKKYFNEMLNVAKRYERQIKKSEEDVNDKSIDGLYNIITESIYYIKDKAYEGKDDKSGHGGPNSSEGSVDKG